MLRIKNDKLSLLKAILSHIDTSLENSEINPELDYDVADMIMSMKEKKSIRELKVIKKELEKWILDMRKNPHD